MTRYYPIGPRLPDSAGSGGPWGRKPRPKPGDVVGERAWPRKRISSWERKRLLSFPRLLQAPGKRGGCVGTLYSPITSQAWGVSRGLAAARCRPVRPPTVPRAPGARSSSQARRSLRTAQRLRALGAGPGPGRPTSTARQALKSGRRRGGFGCSRTAAPSLGRGAAGRPHEGEVCPKLHAGGWLAAQQCLALVLR